MAGLLRLYNTLTRTKEAFAPIDPGNVRLYACGPTVYDDAHIGNARPIIVFDLLFRLLRHHYGEAHVTYVRNVTDVDDKINARATERGVTIRALTDGTLARFHEDLAGLGVLPPTVEPRATDYIAEMRDLIERLVASGHAYVAEDHVLFDVPSMPAYGGLSRRPLDEMEAGARVDVAPYKRSPLDFVLWKPSGPADPAWPSPAGIAAPGRPGWHIECSAMSWKHLGETFDIHAGGIDLVFPHHENEIAQSCCAFGRPTMANVWMHNGFLQVEGEKMSKSLGNFVTLREVLADWPGEVVRLAMMRTHYRQPIDWTLRGLEESRRIWISLGNVVREHMDGTAMDEAFVDALGDDLNTPAALARLFELRQQAERGDQVAGLSLTASAGLLGLFDGMFGLKRSFTFSDDRGGLEPDQLVPSLAPMSGAYELSAIAEHLESRHGDRARSTIEFLKHFATGTTVRELRSLPGRPSRIIEHDAARSCARTAKDWAESDRLRDALKALGVVVKDNKDGTTTWEVAR